MRPKVSVLPIIPCTNSLAVGSADSASAPLLPSLVLATAPFALASSHPAVEIVAHRSDSENDILLGFYFYHYRA
jgi:hypothetical protein